MKAYLKSQNNRVWLSVVNGYTEPTTTVEGKTVKKPEESWDNADHLKATHNSCALNAIFSCVSMPEFQRISTCEIAKDAWDILSITHEGNNQVKQQKLQSIITEFETIRMKDNETFGEFYARLSEVVNFTLNLGEPISQEKIVKKIMRSLPERFITKVEVLECSPNFDSMKVEEIVGHFLTFDTKLSQYGPQKEKNKNEEKSLAFSSRKDCSKGSDSDDGELDQEEMALFVTKFGKFFKKNKTFGPKDKNGGENIKVESSKSKERKLSGLQCYECMGYGHIAQECANKQRNKVYNVKTWDDSDSDEEANRGGNSNFIAFGASLHPHESEFNSENESENGANSISSESDEEKSLQKAYNILYKESLDLKKTKIKLLSEIKKRDEENVKLKQELLEAQARDYLDGSIHYLFYHVMLSVRCLLGGLTLRKKDLKQYFPGYLLIVVLVLYPMEVHHQPLLHERKAEMAREADAFIDLPGWSAKCRWVLQLLYALFDNGVEEGFIKPSAWHVILSAPTAKELFVKMEILIPLHCQDNFVSIVSCFY
ncbi:hypothetical protein RHMOL_Rhmol11G0019700 [Rhododendron molle]|uniref:Uncharacterized protein n=1 Tax=Rhododendron molle TaxID=49168 RepID=A0ACC0LN77_RHOML|nr:hypothetical protein RHMOL_Rhmol11G0019700 [Rhododendron molle]